MPFVAPALGFQGHSMQNDRYFWYTVDTLDAQLVEDPDAVILYGLMVREFGKAAEPSIHGHLVCKVAPGNAGPELATSCRRAQKHVPRRKRMLH